MNALLDWLGHASTGRAVGVMLLENVLLCVFTVLVGETVIRAFALRRAAPAPPPLTGNEVFLAALCVLMNTVVTIAGWWLWRRGVIIVRRDTGWRAWGDVLVLLLAMDLGMYLTHRLAHWGPLFRLLHAPHHRYDHPRPLNLFVLHPLEVLGFGSLWLGVMWLYPASWLGTCVYLTLNLAFGLVGHLGVEPLPRGWAKWWVVRHLGSSTFHAEHHVRQRFNFGFYTLIWDRLFGTLDPHYAGEFERGV